ncbi:hypothetical protein N2152v2_005311 [Parachlorella kessleri]
MAIVNLQKTPKDKKAAVVIHARCDLVMQRLMAGLHLRAEPYTRRDTVAIRVHQHPPRLRHCNGSAADSLQQSDRGGTASGVAPGAEAGEAVLLDPPRAPAACADGSGSDEATTASASSQQEEEYPFTLTVHNQCGRQWPVPLLESVEFRFEDPRLGAAMKEEPPFRVAHTVQHPGSYPVTITLRLSSAADDARRVLSFPYVVHLVSEQQLLQQDQQDQEQTRQEAQQGQQQRGVTQGARVAEDRPRRLTRASALAAQKLSKEQHEEQVVHETLELVSFVTQEVDYESQHGGGVAVATDWRWVDAFELGLQDVSHREAELHAWLLEHGPSSPCKVHLGLVCLRNGQVDCPATVQLYRAVYRLLGPRITSLAINIQRPELCHAAGLLPMLSETPHLERLSIFVAPLKARTGHLQGELRMPVLAGLRELAGLQDVSVSCPALEPSLDQLFAQLPPSTASFSLSLQSGKQSGFKQRGTAHQGTGTANQATGSGAGAAAAQPPPLRLLQQRAHLESLLSLDLSEEDTAEVAVGLPAAAANLSGLTRLALKGVDLTCGRSWHWLRSLSSLQVLSLESSPLEELPWLPHLRSLHLRDSAPPSSLQALPSGTSALTALTELTLAVMNQGQGRNVSLRGLAPSLRSLAMTGQGVYVLPPDLAACTALTSLRLNYLDADSARGANLSLGSLASLRALSISHRLPRGLEHLHGLTSLELRSVNLGPDSGEECVLSGQPGWSLDYAPLAPELELAGLVHEACSEELEACVWDMPLHPVATALGSAPPPPCAAPALPALPSLQALVLRDSVLPVLPASLAATLTQLSIHGGEAPAALPPLPHLAHLALAGCKLRRLPEGLGSLAPALRSLNLSGNPRLGKQQQALLPPLPLGLQRLSLADCSLGEVPRGLDALPALEQLDLGSNVGLQAELSHMPALKHLGLQDCAMYELPQGLIGLASLESLDLRGNPSLEASVGEEAWLCQHFGVEVAVLGGCGGDDGLFGIPPSSGDEDS